MFTRPQSHVRPLPDSFWRLLVRNTCNWKIMKIISIISHSTKTCQAKNLDYLKRPFRLTIKNCDVTSKLGALRMSLRMSLLSETRTNNRIPRDVLSYHVHFSFSLPNSFLKVTSTKYMEPGNHKNHKHLALSRRKNSYSKLKKLGLHQTA